MVADPTSRHVDAQLDPRTRRIEGVAHQGMTPFSAPYVSRITDDLWVGGCADGLELPDEIEYVVSLYPWESYSYHEGVQGALALKLYDAGLADPSLLVAAARMVNTFRGLGQTLVHCQAGLNRSNLVAGLALVLEGMEPANAIALLREKRSPAVLCNRAFEEFLLEEAVSLR